MKTYKQELRQVWDDIICDICNRSIKKIGGYTEEYVELFVTWGYNSNKDGEVHNCDMCEECYDKVRDFIEKTLHGKIQIT